MAFCDQCRPKRPRGIAANAHCGILFLLVPLEGCWHDEWMFVNTYRYPYWCWYDASHDVGTTSLHHTLSSTESKKNTKRQITASKNLMTPLTQLADVSQTQRIWGKYSAGEKIGHPVSSCLQQLASLTQKRRKTGLFFFF